MVGSQPLGSQPLWGGRRRFMLISSTCCSAAATGEHEGGLRSSSGTKLLLAAPGIWFSSLSALVKLASSAACSLCLLALFPPNFPSFEHLQSSLSLFLTCLSLYSNYGYRVKSLISSLVGEVCQLLAGLCGGSKKAMIFLFFFLMEVSLIPNVNHRTEKSHVGI